MRGIGLLLGLILLWGTGCKPTESGPTLVMGCIGRPDTALSLVSHNEAEEELSGAIYRGLWTYDASWEQVPVMASELPAAGKGTLSFTNNQRVIRTRLNGLYKWSDGSEVTGSDYLTAFQLASVPILTNRQPEWRQSLSSVRTAGGELEMSFTSLWPNSGLDFPPFPTGLASTTLASASISRMTREYGRQPVCNGPYVIESWEADGRLLRLKANPHFPWPEKKGPAIPQIELRFYENPRRLIRALARGDVQLAPRIPISLMGDLATQPDLHVPTVATADLQVLIFRTDSPLLRDARVRRALFIAMQRNQWVAQIHPEVDLVPANSWLPERAAYYVPVLGDSPDPDEARREASALLTEAGWTGVKPRKQDKQELRLELLYDADSDLAGKQVAHLAHHFDQVGVVLQPIPVGRPLLEARLKKRDFRHLALFSITLKPWEDPARMFSSRFLPDAGGGGLNYSGWADKQNEELCRALEMAPNSEELARLYAEQQQCFAQEMPFVPLFFMPEVHAVHRTLVGYDPRGFGACTWNCESWRFDERARPPRSPRKRPTLTPAPPLPAITLTPSPTASPQASLTPTSTPVGRNTPVSSPTAASTPRGGP